MHIQNSMEVHGDSLQISIVLVVIGNIYARVNVRDESVLANIAKINPSRTLVILQYVLA